MKLGPNQNINMIYFWVATSHLGNAELHYSKTAVYLQSIFVMLLMVNYPFCSDGY